MKLAIGTDDFARLREGDVEYIDKTALLCEVLDVDNTVLLFPRPRRFGKTLNLSPRGSGAFRALSLAPGRATASLPATPASFRSRSAPSPGRC